MMATTPGSFSAHGLEGDVLGGLDRAGDAPGVLLGEEALGHHDVEGDRGDQGAQGHDQDRERGAGAPSPGSAS